MKVALDILLLLYWLTLAQYPEEEFSKKAINAVIITAAIVTLILDLK